MVFLAKPRSRLSVVITALFILAMSGCSNLSSFLFYPHKGHYQTPDALDLAYERIVLNSEGYALENWLVKSQQAARATILYLHGNGENMSTHINSVAWLTNHQFDVFLLDYRGYGKSGGESTLRSALFDINQAHLWLSTQTDKPLVILGQSMGGALGIAYTGIIGDYAQEGRREFSALISESAPASWPQVAREAMRKHWLTWLIQAPASLIESDYDAEAHIANIQRMPVLLMHSKGDSIVDFKHYEQLAAAMTRPNYSPALHETTGGHTQGFADERTRAVFLDFVNNALTRAIEENEE